jgi:outer membrane protein OmpA-like peptidoglycan-associated protein
MAELRSKGVDVRYSDRGVVINLPDVLFDFGRSSLTSKAHFTIEEIANILHQAPSRDIAVEGHTDSIGSIEHNYHLSDARARGVADDLVKNGIPPRHIAIKALGETDPLSSNRTEEGRRRNRRVEIIILTLR